MNTSGARPFFIRIFLPEDTPDGVRVIKKSNWTGTGIVVPRNLLPDAKSRDEFARTGIYILVGHDDEGELPTIYIGQGDPVRARLERHLGDKDFWTWAVAFVTRDNSLNKAHIGYLSPLSEANAADMDSFLADILNVLPLVGLTAFEKPRAKPGEKSLLYLTGKGVNAQGYAFGSPSTAAAVVLGRPAGGPREWKDDQGRTLTQIQKQEVGEA